MATGQDDQLPELVLHDSQSPAMTETKDPSPPVANEEDTVNVIVEATTNLTVEDGNAPAAPLTMDEPPEVDVKHEDNDSVGAPSRFSAGLSVRGCIHI